jgi:hypothetical protein
LPSTAPTAPLDRLRAKAGQHGWRELFTERYPHAGGSDHTALFIENEQGYEVEIVCPGKPPTSVKACPPPPRRRT